MKLTHYRSASAFLYAYYLDKKQSSKAWSFENWSRKLKMKKTTLQKTVKGQIPMGDAVEAAFCKYFNFKKEEKKYFQLLVASEKISRLYPDISIDFPDLNALKINAFELKTPEHLKKETLELISQPDVQWLITFIGETGRPTKDLNKIENAVHPGLKNINWKALIDLCIMHKVLVQDKDRIYFKFDEKIFLDGQITGLDTAIKRYRRTLNLMNKMISADFELNKAPVTNNRSFCARVYRKTIPEMLNHADKAMKEMYALYSAQEGDVVVDVQVFVSPTINLITS